MLYSTTWHLQLFKAYALFKLCKELLQTLVSCFISHFMSLSTTGLILLNLISTSLHHLMKRRVIGSVLLTTKVTVSPGGSSLRILTRSSFVPAFAVPSELQQASIYSFWHSKCTQNYNKPASCITFRGGDHTSFSHSLSSTISNFFAT